MRFTSIAVIALIATTVSASPVDKRKNLDCGGQYYDPATGFCTNGHICPSGHGYCGPWIGEGSWSCYLPDKYFCLFGKLYQLW
ncbi:hypothetical protein BC937DRAFT_92136 [Endogone sp. FLAS-F59071]|nr:hypothetical protein BC937DRAFT_92136 [Endogone sp. FLAS-F59071]|eukprot:RUS15679.1 hypothetical protein BC937DRAFT_92136 [Endogone sp. FLAS-F59071]